MIMYISYYIKPLLVLLCAESNVIKIFSAGIQFVPGDTNQRRKRKEREKNMNWSVYLLLIKG